MHVCVCVRACVRACVRTCVRTCVRAYVRTYVRPCVGARACVQIVIVYDANWRSLANVLNSSLPLL